MNLNPAWQDIALRLALTMIAAGLIGFNREARGHAAGLRTTVLVGLAAAIAMTLTNVLLSTGGKPPDSYATMDTMRLPLGVLTGVGFIGGGAILKRGASITGVTTAATLWIVTAIGFCFGSGQIGLGVAGSALAMVTLWAMQWIDQRIKREHRAMLVLTMADDAPPPDLNSLIGPWGYRAVLRRQHRGENATEAEIGFEIRWKQAEVDDVSTRFLDTLGETHRVKSFELISEDTH